LAAGGGGRTSQGLGGNHPGGGSSCSPTSGEPIKSVKTGFKSALKLAGLADEDLSPHSLRHTAVTWALQGGATTFQAAGLAGMSEDMVRRVYGHHHPGFMREAVDAIQRRRLPSRAPQKALPPPDPASISGQ
jgi:integrase